MSFRLPFIEHHRYRVGDGSPTFMSTDDRLAVFSDEGSPRLAGSQRHRPDWNEYISPEHLERRVVEVLLTAAELAGTLNNSRSIHQFAHDAWEEHRVNNKLFAGLLANPETAREISSELTFTEGRVYSCIYMPVGTVLAIPESAELGIVATRPVDHLRFYASFVIWAGPHLVWGTPTVREPRTLWERILD